MLKTRIYMVQLVGVILLLCCSLLRDQPDRLSRMHFDSAAKTVIKKDLTDGYSRHKDQTHVVTSTHHSDRHKTSIPKHISFELMLPIAHTSYTAVAIPFVQHAAPIYKDYCYLFYKEINPPPPKC